MLRFEIDDKQTEDDELNISKSFNAKSSNGYCNMICSA